MRAVSFNEEKSTKNSNKSETQLFSILLIMWIILTSGTVIHRLLNKPLGFWILAATNVKVQKRAALFWHLSLDCVLKVSKISGWKSAHSRGTTELTAIF